MHVKQCYLAAKTCRARLLNFCFDAQEQIWARDICHRDIQQAILRLTGTRILLIISHFRSADGTKCDDVDLVINHLCQPFNTIA